MNRMIRSGLTCLVLVLLGPVVLNGCVGLCYVACVPSCTLELIREGLSPEFAILFCTFITCSVCQSFPYLTCAENPDDECSATFEQFQDAAIRFCETYPEECQEAFEAWVESLDTAAEE